MRNKMCCEPEYLKYTQYHYFPGGRRKLSVMMDVIARLAARVPDGKLCILDVGCGNGALTLPLASCGHTVLGIDISAEAIEKARGVNVFDNVSFEVRNLIESPLNMQFDVIICSEVLEHLSNPVPLIRAMEHELKPDGRLFITVPNGYGLREVMGRAEHRLRENRFLSKTVDFVRRLLGMRTADEKHSMHTNNPDQDHVQKFTVHSLRRLLVDNGFNISLWVGSFFFFSLFGAAQCGDGLVAEFDEWMADAMPLMVASGWYILCHKQISGMCEKHRKFFLSRLRLRKRRTTI